MTHVYELCRFTLINSDDKKESDIVREYLDEIYCAKI